MQDRLQDLRAVLADRSPALLEKLPGGVSAVLAATQLDGFDLEAQLGISQKVEKEAGKGDAFMGDYFVQVDGIKDGIAKINADNEALLELRGKLIRTATPEGEKEVSRQSQVLLNGINRSIQTIKSALEALKAENEVFLQRNSDSSEARIRVNMHAALTRKFREVITESQGVQTQYKKAVQDRMERQLRIVNPEASEDEIREMVSTGDSGAAAAAIHQKITGTHESLQIALGDIQDKYRDVKRLEQSVVEMHQMFMDLATLVQEQGEILDQIEFAVSNAKDYTEQAERELVEARKHQAKSQKRSCWISACVVCVAVCIMLPVIVYFA